MDKFSNGRIFQNNSKREHRNANDNGLKQELDLKGLLIRSIKMNASKISISSLPDVVLDKVLRLLTSQDLRALHQVSRNFKKIVEVRTDVNAKRLQLICHIREHRENIEGNDISPQPKPRRTPRLSSEKEVSSSRYLKEANYTDDENYSISTPNSNFPFQLFQEADKSGEKIFQCVKCRGPVFSPLSSHGKFQRKMPKNLDFEETQFWPKDEEGTDSGFIEADNSKNKKVEEERVQNLVRLKVPSFKIRRSSSSYSNSRADALCLNNSINTLPDADDSSNLTEYSFESTFPEQSSDAEVNTNSSLFQLNNLLISPPQNPGCVNTTFPYQVSSYTTEPPVHINNSARIHIGDDSYSKSLTKETSVLDSAILEDSNGRETIGRSAMSSGYFSASMSLEASTHSNHFAFHDGKAKATSMKNPYHSMSAPATPLIQSISGGEIRLSPPSHSSMSLDSLTSLNSENQAGAIDKSAYSLECASLSCPDLYRSKRFVLECPTCRYRFCSNCKLAEHPGQACFIIDSFNLEKGFDSQIHEQKRSKRPLSSKHSGSRDKSRLRRIASLK